MEPLFRNTYRGYQSTCENHIKTLKACVCGRRRYGRRRPRDAHEGRHGAHTARM